MICYICKKEINEDDNYISIGKGKDGIEMFRHDDDEHREMVLTNFIRNIAKGEQIG